MSVIKIIVDVGDLATYEDKNLFHGAQCKINSEAYLTRCLWPTPPQHQTRWKIHESTPWYCNVLFILHYLFYIRDFESVNGYHINSVYPWDQMTPCFTIYIPIYVLTKNGINFLYLVMQFLYTTFINPWWSVSPKKNLNCLLVKFQIKTNYFSQQ